MENKVEKKTWRNSLIFLALMAVLFVSVNTISANGKDDTKQAKAIVNLKETSKAFSEIAEQYANSVAYIKVQKKVAGNLQRRMDPFEDFFNDDIFKHFFRDQFPRRQPMPRKQPQKEFYTMGQGSGFVVSEDGHILTNNHVVGDADKITVQFSDGRSFDAKLVGTDSATDVAVIKIDGDDLKAMPIGDSNKIKVGEWSVAIGNPFGLKQTVTAGIISAKGRSSVGIVDYENFIQTDAAINPGNSGGPLLNLDGEVIGINSAIYSKSGGYMGIGFAIPINMAMDVYRQLVDEGKVTRGFIGVLIQDMNKDLADSFGMDSTKGALVSEIQKDSPAEKSGLKSGDVVIAIDGKEVENSGDLRNRVALKKPGTDLTFKVIRDGDEKEFKITIGARDKILSQLGTAGGETTKELGLSVKNLSADEAKRMGYEGEFGVVVTEVTPNGQAAMLGLTPGNLIVEINRQKIKNVKDYNKAISEALEKKSILMKVKSGQGTRFLVLKF